MSSPQHALYLPRMLLEWLSTTPETSRRTFEGTAVFADVSGFTALTESLAVEHGKGGAERITRIMNEAFTELVDIIFMEGGDLLRYGGDAVFAFFSGDNHAGRAVRAALDMGKEITEIDAGEVDLGISIGLTSGEMEVVLVGSTNREMFFSGPAVDGSMAAETAAGSGQVFAPPEFCDELPGATFAPAGDFVEVTEEDPDTPFLDDEPDVQIPEAQDYSAFISADLRERLTLALVGGEHRPASIGFVMFHEPEGMDPDEREGALAKLFERVRVSSSKHAIGYLGNDVYPQGGKFLVADGVPQRSAGSEGVAAALHEIVTLDSPFSLHGGCARGYVFAGDLGAPNRRAYTVMADTTNLAARLAAAAPAGAVLVTEAALERARGTFETERAEPLQLKGKSMSVSPFRIVHVTEEEESEEEVPLFGRDLELAQLRRTLSVALSGDAGVVALTAPLGLGKSLLADTATADIPKVVSVRSGRETARGSGFIGRLLEQTLGLDEESTAASQLSDLAAKSERTTDDDKALMLRSLGVETEIEGEEEPPEQVATRLGRAIADLLEDLQADEPTLFRFDNAGEAGPAAKAVINELAMRTGITAWGVLAISDEPLPWLNADTHIALEPFDEEQSHAFVRHIVGDSALPSQTIEQIMQRAMGNPYILQELTSSALEGGEVPESIEAAAVAKMDRLDPRDEQLLCLAAVLGTEARIELLTAVLPDPALAEDASSWARLQDFVDTSIVGKIKFRDPVLREAAYGILPMQRRREAHSRVARTIEQRARRRPERYAGELAYHFHRAENFAKSWEYSRLAAETSRRRLDLYGSVLGWRQALEAATHLEIDPLELAGAEEGLGDACETAALYEEAVAAYEKAARLLSDATSLARLDSKIGIAYVRLGNPDEARSHLERALEKAEAAGAADIQLQAMAGIAGLEIRRGHVEEAGHWCDRAINEGDVDQNPAPIARAYYIKSLVSARLGLPTAEEEAQKALEISESIGDKIGAANALNNLGTRAFYTGNWEKSEEYHRRNLETRRMSGDVLGAALAGYNLGELYLEQGRFEESRALLERSLAEFRGAGHLVGEAASRLTLGRLATRTSLIEAADDHFETAERVAAAADASDQLNEAKLGRVELALAVGDISRASALLQELPGDLSGPSLVRRHLYEAAVCFGRRSASEARELLDQASGEASTAGAKHLEFAVAEMRARLFREAIETAAELGAPLALVARPVIRAGAHGTADLADSANTV